MKRILAIHDLSYFGRCALTVIIPTLSSMAHQVIPLPTALLSTHTGGFEKMVMTDLSEKMLESFEHMRESGASFDAVYSGFLASEGQIDTVSEIIKRCKDALILVDPVMGDDGKLYKTYTQVLASRMSELCSLADVITPNLTEAAFLLGEEYKGCADLTYAKARALAKTTLSRLQAKYGCKHIALTGIEFEKNGKLYIAVATLEGESFDFLPNPFEGTGYPGTGDIFASVLIGDMLNGKSFKDASSHAAEFIKILVLDTYSEKTPVRNGVLLEKNLYRLVT